MKRDTIALEYMKIVLTTSERFNDYSNEEDIMVAIAKDAYLMADTMLKVGKEGMVKLKKSE